MSAWRIRRARAAEAEALSEPGGGSKASWSYDANFVALAGPALAVERAAIAGGDVWAAALAGSRLGVLALAPEAEAGALGLDKLFVRPERLRQGIGRALLAHAETEARRHGGAHLRILADPNAAGFYERQCAACRRGAVRRGARPIFAALRDQAEGGAAAAI